METTIMGYVWYILGLYWDNGRKIETIIMGYVGYILGLYWDNGKENGNYTGLCGVYIRVILG